MSDPQVLEVAVALIQNNGGLAFSWNEKWQAFGLPMTKIIAGPPAEYAEHAAVRAAAEVLHLPCRVVPGKMGRKTRKLQLSSRDSGIKDYHFTLVPIEVHLDFQDLLASHRSVIFLDVSKLRDKEYEPVSPTVKPILDACAEWGWL